MFNLPHLEPCRLLCSLRLQTSGEKFDQFSTAAFWESPTGKSHGQSGRMQQSSDKWASSAAAPWNTHTWV